MSLFQSHNYSRRDLRENQSYHGVLQTSIPGGVQISAMSQVNGEHLPPRPAWQLPTNAYEAYGEFTDGDDNQELLEGGFGPSATASTKPEHEISMKRFNYNNLSEASSNLAQAGEPTRIACNPPNLLGFNGLTALGTPISGLTDPFVDGPPPEDFDYRGNWSSGIPDLGFLPAPNTYGNETNYTLGDFPISFSGDSSRDQGFCYLLFKTQLVTQSRFSKSSIFKRSEQQLM